MLIRTIFISLVLGVLPSSVFAGSDIDNYKKKLQEDLVSKPTDSLIWVRAINNTYSMFCKSMSSNEHRFYSKVVSPVITKYIATDAMQRSDWGFSGDTKYHFRKGKLVAFKKKYGTRLFCDCSYASIIKGDQCFNSIEQRSQ
jgi:hypothetical protein